MTDRRAGSGRLVAGLSAFVVAMFGFGFLMVPMYEKFCEITGFNGIVRLEASGGPGATAALDPDRKVRVEFVSTVNEQRPWRFEPDQSSMLVTPGNLYTATFMVENLQGSDASTQIVPSVAPGLVARHLNKTECFCFTEQRFAGNEVRSLPVTFYLDPAIPERTTTVTLSYTLFDLSVGDTPTIDAEAAALHAGAG